MSLSITHSTSIDAESWDRYVSTAPGASLYHLLGWKQVIEETFAHPTVYFSAVDSSAGIVGVLPLAQLKSRLFGNMLVSLPFFNYGGVCGASDEVRHRLLESAIDVARERSVDFLEIRHEDGWLHALPCKTSKVSMRLALPASADDLWKAIGAKIRNQVQKPRKEGMVSAIGREERLDAFYDVFAANMRDLGTPVYPKAFFRNILRRFPEQTWIGTVHLADRPVAAAFLAGFRDRLEIPWASSLRAFNRLGPNMLLYWTCLEFACQRGYRVFDFGRSTPGEGTYQFKAQWGATPHQLFWYYWLPDDREIPQVNPRNPRYRAAIAVWQRLPVAVSRYLGPHVVKYIP